MSEPGVLGEALEQAGFTVERVESIELTRRHASFEELWDVQLDMSRWLHDAALSLPEKQIEQLKAALRERFARFAAADGSLEIPGRALGALAAA
jgi:hypothetical protein